MPNTEEDEIELGQDFASLLEHATNNSYESSVESLMRLVNRAARETPKTGPANELAKHGSAVLREKLTTALNQSCQSCTAHIRSTGKVDETFTEEAEILRVLSILVGIDLIEGKATLEEEAGRVEKLMKIRVRVGCEVAKSNAETRPSVKIPEKMNAFLEAIESMCDLIQETSSFLTRSSAYFQAVRESKDAMERTLDEILSSGSACILETVTHLFDVVMPVSVVRASPNHELLPDELHALVFAIRQMKRVSRRSDQELNAKIMDCVSRLIQEEEIFLEVNARVALESNQVLETREEDEVVSLVSYVEDVFHVFDACLARADHSTSREAIDSVTSKVVTHCGDEMTRVFRSSWREARHRVETSSFDAKTLLLSSEEEMSAAGFALANAWINSMCLAQRFVKDLEQQHHQDQQSLDSAQSMEDHMALSLIQDASTKLRRLAEEAVEEIVTDVMKRRTSLGSKLERVFVNELDPRGEPYVEKMGKKRPVMRAPCGEIATRDVSAWLEKFVSEYDKSLSNAKFPWDAKMCQEIRVMVLKSITKRVAGMMERELSKLTFTELGALGFEADVRFLCEYMVRNVERALKGGSSQGARMHHAVRGEFIRLRQWGLVLVSSDETTMSEGWRALMGAHRPPARRTAGGSVLSQEEIDLVRSLRVR